MTVSVVPATADRWPDVVTVFGRQRRGADACWCQRFRQPTETDRRAELRREIETAEIPVGLVAYAENAPVGWTRVVPRSTLPGVSANRALQRLLPEDPSAWWLSCFVVRPDQRGEGIGIDLLRAAAEWARSHGASVLDGHPVDTALLTGRVSASAVFTGTVSMFRAAGFTELGRSYPSRPVMRRRFDISRQGEPR